jgi:hypothetical protein
MSALASCRSSDSDTVDRSVEAAPVISDNDTSTPVSLLVGNQWRRILRRRRERFRSCERGDSNLAGTTRN